MNWDLLQFILVGFVAQLVDGALGMAYGVLSMSFLLGLGVPPAAASASVHISEIFTTGLSGLSHLYHKNVDRRLFARLAVPGMVGGVIGAYLLTVAPVDVIKPVIAAYLAIVAAYIFWKAFRKMRPRHSGRGVVGLGFVGGFFDALGGGGWGPIVGGTLIAHGLVPRFVIGSLNLAEFFMAAAASATFVLSIRLDFGLVLIGLLIGGGIAAPFGAFITKRLPARPLMILVAATIMALSVHAIWRAFA